MKRVIWLRLAVCGGLLCGAAGGASEAAADGGSWAGTPLADALVRLQAEGLRIVFSSGQVRPEMRVGAEPGATEAEGILDEILAPHGLAVRRGEGGVFVVVAAGEAVSEASRAGPGRILGTVGSRRTASPLSGVTVVELESGAEAQTSAEGGFELAGLEAGTYTLEARMPGFVVDRLEGVEVSPGGTATVRFALVPSPLAHEEIVITPSRVTLLQDEPSTPLALSREEVFSLPHLADDVFRALTLLPGTASNDVTAQFHVRGGRRDEVQILLDGQELYEGYHLKDFDSALSIVGSGALESLDLSTGGFPARYGDRMSGVLDMTTLVPRGGTRTLLGLSLLTAQAGSAGTFGGGHGHFLALGRRGSADLAARILREDNPDYWDLFGKAEWSFAGGQLVRAQLLRSADVYALEERDGEESKRFDTDYDGGYLWLTHQAILGTDLLVETAAARTRVDRDRRGVEDEEEQTFDIRDERRFDVTELRQHWDLQAPRHQTLSWGFEARRYEADYDYRSRFSYATELARLRGQEPDGERLFRESFEGDHLGLHAADRFEPVDGLNVELGLRWDRYTLTDEDHLSPRLNAALTLGKATVVRAAWGTFTQSHRPYELQAEDGETRFQPAERAEHRVLGIEHLFGAGSAKPGPSLRVELYQREIDNPRPRWENLYEPRNVFPEVEPDRILVEPTRARASGLEVFLRGSGGPRVSWFLSYALSRVDDTIGGVEVPRPFDQTQALALDLGYRFGPKWSLNAAWRYHTGWPTTRLDVEEVIEEGEGGEGDGGEGDEEEAGGEPETILVPVLGPLRAERLEDYHRLDLRASRRWKTRSSELVFFVDVQNLYGRENVAGFDHAIEAEEGGLVTETEQWLGFTASAGIRWEF